MIYVCPSPGCTHTYDSPIPITGASHECPKAGDRPKRVLLKEVA